MFFILILGLRLQKYSTNTKRYPPKKVFGKSEFRSSRQKSQFSKLLGLLWFWREEQNSEFPKTFFGGYLFVFVEYLCNRSLKITTKNIKNYKSILAIINYRNWLDNSPPLSFILRMKICLVTSPEQTKLRCTKIDRTFAH